jgi:hypothetical protein
MRIPEIGVVEVGRLETVIVGVDDFAYLIETV